MCQRSSKPSFLRPNTGLKYMYSQIYFNLYWALLEILPRINLTLYPFYMSEASKFSLYPNICKNNSTTEYIVELIYCLHYNLLMLQTAPAGFSVLLLLEKKKISG